MQPHADKPQFAHRLLLVLADVARVAERRRKSSEAPPRAPAGLARTGRSPIGGVAASRRLPPTARPPFLTVPQRHNTSLFVNAKFI